MRTSVTAWAIDVPQYSLPVLKPIHRGKSCEKRVRNFSDCNSYDDGSHDHGFLPNGIYLWSFSPCNATNGPAELESGTRMCVGGEGGCW